MSEALELYEVFVRARRGLDHRHVGSLRAEDPRAALEYAREIYTRRQEGVSLWVARSADITASQEDDVESFFESANDKPYRQPTYYTLPEGVRNL
jgi:ring-1,2-phenylacetyl-CoA epoxidase subunit PaaB